MVFQNAVEGIALFTPDNRITSCNPAVARMFGRRLESLTGMFITDLLRHPCRHGTGAERNGRWS